jgi:pimeloyl-ACP methyl ester carboxylesterase
VHDGNREIEYVRAGSGRTVILLAGPAANGSAPLFEALAHKHRVIQPTNHEAASNLTWLAGFLDCLGVARMSLIASAEYALPALQFALAEPERVERLALLNADAQDAENAPLTDVLVERSQPLLLLAANGNGPLPTQIQALVEFLAS